MLSIPLLKAQTDIINMSVELLPQYDELKISQFTVYHNHSKDTLSSIFLHDWANSYKSVKTPLAQRFLEDYDKSFYFASSKERGYTNIKSMYAQQNSFRFERVKGKPDVLELKLSKPLLPNDSLKFVANYTVKIPSAKFTNYGYTDTGYHLRFWYLVPAVYNGKWQLMSNLNIDDLYMNLANYHIHLTVPKAYVVGSNSYQSEKIKGDQKQYSLTAKNDVDIILNIDKESKFTSYQTPFAKVHTDILNKKVNPRIATGILTRELRFLKEHLGNYPYKDIYIDNATQRKNPVYGFDQLPSVLRPFSDVFKWDKAIFKSLTKKYIDNTLLLNKRSDYWLTEGLQTYLMMKYTKKFYPKVNLIGRISELWGIRNYNLAKLKYTDKYLFVYQFGIRNHLDQSLNTSAEDLSNFNRKLTSKYKAGLGLQYLKGYLEEGVLDKVIKLYYQQNFQKIASSQSFKELLMKHTKKDLSWFFEDYLQTTKKIDYTIDNSKLVKDSVQVTIRNKSNFTAPVALYGLQDKKIVYKKWFSNIQNSKTVSIPRGTFDRLALNYENLYPEYNTINNFKTIKKRLFNKPIRFRLQTDVENAYYSQIYVQPEFGYNYYDGLTVLSTFHNSPIIDHDLQLSISPAYGFKSNSLTGSFGIRYSDYGDEQSKIYRVVYGFGGKYRHYKKNLTYKRFSPYVNIEFKRKSLRDVGQKSIGISLSHLNKQVPDSIEVSPQDRYTIFSASYSYSKPDILRGVNYFASLQVSDMFSKFTTEYKYRRLTKRNTRIEFRGYAGVFLKNKTKNDYFSIGLDRANDYLFGLNYYGRSETSGFLGQQFIMAEGGFKSKLSTRYANQYLVSFNSSIGVWRWIEIYNDVAFVKNKGQRLFSAYENGIRLNFVPNILELYLPVYSNNGFEIGQKGYPKKFRFVLTANIGAMYNFFRRGFL